MLEVSPASSRASSSGALSQLRAERAGSSASVLPGIARALGAGMRGARDVDVRVRKVERDVAQLVGRQEALRAQVRRDAASRAAAASRSGRSRASATSAGRARPLMDRAPAHPRRRRRALPDQHEVGAAGDPPRPAARDRLGERGAYRHARAPTSMRGSRRACCRCRRSGAPRRRRRCGCRLQPTSGRLVLTPDMGRRSARRPGPGSTEGVNFGRARPMGDDADPRRTR